MASESPQFLAVPSPGLERADALLLPIPVEKTVSYGTGTVGGPRAILDASPQIETFDEETLIEFAEAPRLHVLPAVSSDGDIETCLSRIRDSVRLLRGRFLVGLGGEHTITYGMVAGLLADQEAMGDSGLAGATVVQIDAHADLANTLHGRHWSHGTVMRRLWEHGCRLVQIGIRSLTRDEYDLATNDSRITCYLAHHRERQWKEILQTLRDLEGDVYLTIDVDGLDPAIIPSTGTPQPDGLSWRQTMELIRVLTNESPCRLVGADVVEFVPSPVPPGCDATAARLVAKLLAYWWAGRGSGND